ncbi:MAG: ABC transporter permease [Actinobacteria bacterium]|nr:ABC transporter permease [Actinomycetota bacterium]
MNILINLVKRNLKLYFRDRTSVFFSLLAVFIIIMLYVLFLGNMMVGNLKEMLGNNARFAIDSWVMAGLLSVTSITTTMGAFGTLVEDKTKKIIKDFSSAPLKRSTLAGGYIVGSFIIGLIMSIVTLIIAEVYIIANGGKLIGLLLLAELLGIMLLSVFASSAMVFFIASFFKTNSAFGTASTIIGTLIGFLTGIYIPIGSLPSGVQTIIKIFPTSHAAVLFRQIMMRAPMSAAFKNAPVQAATSFKQAMGVVFYVGNKELSPLINILVLVATGIIFYT